MAKQIGRLPGWIAAVLAQWGVNIDEALAEYNQLAVKYDLPAEWTAAVNAWATKLAENASNPAVAQALVLAIVAELTSETPGYNPDAGGVA